MAAINVLVFAVEQDLLVVRVVLDVIVIIARGASSSPLLTVPISLCHFLSGEIYDLIILFEMTSLLIPAVILLTFHDVIYG